jgi:hypothetical protein
MQSCYSIESFKSVCEDSAGQQRQTLCSVFDLNGKAGHLRKHGIAEEKEGADVEALLQSLPMTAYGDYQPAVEAAIKASAHLGVQRTNCGLPTYYQPLLLAQSIIQAYLRHCRAT